MIKKCDRGCSFHTTSFAIFKTTTKISIADSLCLPSPVKQI